MTSVTRVAAGTPPNDNDGPPEPLFEEAFRTLRANLLLRLTDTTKILMVTGARPLDGKSTVAAKLACSFASIGRVALIDADFRRPRQHEVFGLPKHPGFADVLAGTVRFESCLHEVSKSLAVVTSGTTPNDPVELLDRDHLDVVLAPLRTEFKLVVIDSPPVLAVADATLIGARVDAVLVVLRAGEVTIAEARLVRQRLESTGSKLIGSVLSRFPNAHGAGYHPYVNEYADTPAGVPGAPKRSELERDGGLKPVNHSA